MWPVTPLVLSHGLQSITWSYCVGSLGAVGRPAILSFACQNSKLQALIGRHDPLEKKPAVEYWAADVYRKHIYRQKILLTA